MSIVVADTGPINYLVLIGHIDVLPTLFGKVFLPPAVRDELTDPNAPQEVQDWLASLPAWVEVRTPTPTNDAALEALDQGESAAIALAIQLHADLLLMDDRRGVMAARTMGLRAAGTLAVLGLAGRQSLLDLRGALNRLRRTTFRYRQEIMDQFLAEQGGEE